MSADDNTLLQIDFDAMLKSKLGKKSRYVPKFLVKALERAISIDRLNWLFRHNYGKRGAEFAHGVLSDLNVNVAMQNTSNLPPAQNRRILVVSNHPLGGLDGLALIDKFQQHFGGQVYFIVNDMLMAIEPLTDVFVPVNKVGAQSRDSVSTIDNIFASEHPILIFPAGLVSRLGDDGKICDLEWKKMFVNKAIEYQRDILPIFVSGKNSNFFYKFARLRKRLGLKFNIEMIRLPRELFLQHGQTLNIFCGQLISWKNLVGGAHARATAEKVKQLVYNLNIQR